MRCFYAYRYTSTNDEPLEYMRFTSKGDRDDWVADVMGRRPCKADEVPSGASKGLPWQVEEFTLLDGRKLVAAFYSWKC